MDVSATARRDFFFGVLFFILCMGVYNANMRVTDTGDTRPARYLPFAICRDGSLRLDSVLQATEQGSSHPYWIVTGNDRHAISLYPVVAPIAVSPLYLPAKIHLDHQGWDPRELESTARIMEKISASLIASLSVALMYFLLRRRATLGVAVLLTIAYAFGTNTWAVSSQALWQHGMGELLIVAAMLLLTGRCTPMRALIAGVVCGLVACNRPPDAILAAALGAYGAFWWPARDGRRVNLFARPAVWLFVLGALVPGVLLMAYNFDIAGGFLGGYGQKGKPSFFDNDILQGIAGMLVSPSRGLFVFTPFLLFLLFYVRRAWWECRERPLFVLAGVAVIVQLLLYAKADWRIGASWGPRWLTDAVPLLVWMLVPAVTVMKKPARIAFAALVAVSIAIQAVGAFWYTGVSDGPILRVVTGPDRMHAAWDFGNIPYITEFRHAPAPRDLLLRAEGCIDSVRAAGRDAYIVPPGSDLIVEGWALANRRTPTAVSVSLVAKDPAGWGNPSDAPQSSSTFYERPDVTAAMHSTGPAGWRIHVPADAARAGAYTLEARVSGGGEFRLVMRREVIFLPYTMALPPGIPADVNLAETARRVAEKIGADQEPGGYWLTLFSPDRRHSNLRPEMNTFLTSVMADLLAPVAAQQPALAGNLARARAHLSSQIEESGLVRYHGRTDSPGMFVLGVPITPDADDTALAWRIGGGKSELLPGALKTLAEYRTPAGLYRTWLAPRADFISIDPGADPNPPDVAIQMHLLLFFAKVSPPDAQALQRALQDAIAGDDLWVYYKMTSLIPLLREVDLREAGYPVTIPASRRDVAQPGQERWLEMCLQIAAYHSPNPPPAAQTEALLRVVAKNDFSTVRAVPPLIYHNDLTASVRRFYWSYDFGYALWLRLYAEYAHANRAAVANPER